MYRYLGLIWNTADPQVLAMANLLARRVRAASAEWRCVVFNPGLRVFHTGVRPGSSEAYVLPERRGVVLGRLFDRHAPEQSSPPQVVLDGRASATIINTAGRRLISNYWGRYVAFLHDRSSSQVHVVRDPSGGLPCMLTTYAGVRVIFSCPQDCALLGVPPFSINWKYVAAHLAFQALQIHQTGLNEVTEILGGECVTFRSDRIERTAYWRAADVSADNVIEDPREAVARLRDTTRACVRAWASCYGSILHTLSGGLDSSIVLSCLRDLPSQPAITCLNYVTQDAEGDERRFARLAARTTDCDLVEHERDTSVLALGEMLRIVPFVRPWSYRYSLEHSRFEAALARDKAASVIFGGGGGDQLFYKSRADLAVADYAYMHGPGPRLFNVALDAARVEGGSIWAELRAGIRDGLFTRYWDPFVDLGRHTTLVSAELLQRSTWDDRFINPWLLAPKRIAPGKRWHIQLLTIPQVFYDSLASANDPERVHPLVAQPLIEVCLRIPTFVLISGGWDRAIARRAFVGDVPREIISRRTKGGITNHGNRIIQANLALIRELLLDGQLVGRRLLKRDKLEELLSGRRSLSTREYGEIEEHLSTEIWLGRWSEQRDSAAA